MEYSKVLEDFEKIIAESSQLEIPKEVALGFMVMAYNRGVYHGMNNFKQLSADY